MMSCMAKTGPQIVADTEAYPKREHNRIYYWLTGMCRILARSNFSRGFRTSQMIIDAVRGEPISR